jgi:hypothetical protein
LVGPDEYFMESGKWTNQEDAVFFLQMKAGNFALSKGFAYFTIENLQVDQDIKIYSSPGMNYQGPDIGKNKGIRIYTPPSVGSETYYIASGNIILSNDGIGGGYFISHKYAEEYQSYLAREALQYTCKHGVDKRYNYCDKCRERTANIVVGTFVTTAVITTIILLINFFAP